VSHLPAAAGDEHAAVLGVLDRQLQAIVEDGGILPPAARPARRPARGRSVAAEAARDALREEEPPVE
jgi:hypothetical protein